MSDLDHKMDQILRDRLKDHDAGAPLHLWSNIVQERASKKRFGFWFYLKGGALGLALLAASWLAWSALSTSAANQESSSISNTQLLPFYDVTSAATASKTTETTSSEEIAITPTPGETESSTLSIESQSGTLIENKATENQNNATIHISAQSDYFLPAVDDVLTEKGVNLSTYPNSKTAASSTHSNASKSEVGLSKRSLLIEPIIIGQPAAMPISFAKGIVPGKCVSFDNPNWKTYLDLYYSPDYAIRSLTAKSSEYGEYAALRAKESFQYAFTTGMRWNVVSPRGFGIRVGLQYSQIGELFSHQDEDAVQQTIVNEYDDFGQIISSDTSYIYGTEVYEIHNYYRTLDVPIMLGYEWELNRMTFTVYGGVIANLWFNKKGKFFEPEMESIVEFTDDSENQYPAFKENLSAHFAGSFGFQYQFAPDYFMLFEPHFRVFPKGITRDDYPLNQKYFVSGVAIGLRYRW